MRYSESSELSAEYLRLALPMLSQHKVSVNPVNYAVAYEYVSGTNEQLAREVDSLQEKDQKLTNEVFEELFRKYVSEYDPDRVTRLQNEFRSILQGIQSSVTQVDDQASRFDQSLQEYEKRLNPNLDIKAVAEIVDGILNETHLMQGSNQELKGQLEESTVQVDSLRKELDRVKQEAMVDPLTGLVNRSGFESALARVIKAASNDVEPACLLMADIDNFKRINDSYGHLLGDIVLKAVAHTLNASVKGKDTAARYGGEEFAVVLPDTQLEGARALAENIRSLVEKGQIRRQTDRQPIGQVTISIGVAAFRPGDTREALIERADRALYRAKNAGRNRVLIEEDRATRE